jgi:glycolate oxidase
MLALIEKIAATHNIPIATIAHAGDGNLHPCLVTPKGDLDARDRALAAFQAIIDAAIDMGGTVTGEHGVGLLKRAGMQREVGPVGLAMQRAIKDALDPRGILNPGKVVG